MKKLHVRLRGLERAARDIGAIQTQIVVRDRCVVAVFGDDVGVPPCLPGAYLRPAGQRWKYTLKGDA